MACVACVADRRGVGRRGVGRRGVGRRGVGRRGVGSVPCRGCGGSVGRDRVASEKAEDHGERVGVSD